MVTSVSASAAPGAVAAVPEAKSASAPPAIVKPTAAGEDTVKISATAQEIKQPTSAQVRLLRAEGQSIPQIATKLRITPQAVQSYLGAPAQAPKKSK